MNLKAGKLIPGGWVLALSLLIAGPSPAQTAGATLSGTIKDSLGTVVPNAKVVVKNTGTGEATEAQANAAGRYSVANLLSGNYEVSVSAEGFEAKVATVQLTVQTNQTLDVALASISTNVAKPALGDLGFPTAQGSAQDQARLDRRSHMLMIHQRLGLITLAPLVATLITSSGASRHGTVAERDWHAALGGAAIGMYAMTATYAIRAPKIEGTATRGPIRLHKTLAWIHGTGMVLTPILGIMAYEQLNRGEKVHGIASAHGAVAWTTSLAYGAAILSVSFKF